MKARCPPCGLRFGSLTGGRSTSPAKPRTSRGFGLNFGGPPELPRMAQHHSRTSVHGLNQAPDMDIHIPIPRQLSHRIAVCTQAYHRKPALLVRSLRRANVHIASAVRNLHHIINMRGNANVFVEEIRGVVRGDAGLCCRIRECPTDQQHDQRSSQ